MKTIFKGSTFIALAAAMAFSSCCKESLEGNGHVETRQFNISDFNGISTSGQINIVLTQSSEYSVSVEAESNIIDAMELNVKGSTLEAGFRNNIGNVKTHHDITVFVSAPDFREASASGESNITSNGDLDLDYLKIEASGEVTATLKGTANTEEIDGSGNITIHNFDLIADAVNIDLSGNGDVEITANVSLDVDASGNAVIKYKGNPSISTQISGSAKLIHVY